jgi:glucose/arabinose dehydrogenase
MRTIVSLAACIALGAMGCGGGDDATGQVETDAPQIPLTKGSGDGTSTARTAAPGARLRRIGNFDSPTYLTSPPGDRRRVFVVEQAGTIREVVDGRKLAKPFLDISSQVLAGGERGLLSMAFAPDYATSHLYYVDYTGKDGDIHIQEFPTGRELIRIEHSTYSNHNGGQLEFGPDGRLYAGTGDGGGGGDPFRNAQNPTRLLGKILRFNAARTQPEVYAIGLRNPWRFSFDRSTNDVVIADVGQDKYEEVDFVKRGTLRGKNFGWSRFEGFHPYYGGSVPNYAKPVLETSHANGNCSITGGYIVRDRSLKALYGRYVFGDYCNPQLRWAKLGPGRARPRGTLGLKVSALSSFGQDGRGRVYAVSQNGPVYRLVPR